MEKKNEAIKVPSSRLCNITFHSIHSYLRTSQVNTTWDFLLLTEMYTKIGKDIEDNFGEITNNPVSTTPIVLLFAVCFAN